MKRFEKKQKKEAELIKKGDLLINKKKFKNND